MIDPDRAWLAAHGIAEPLSAEQQAERDNAIRRLQRPTIGLTRAVAEMAVDDLGVDLIRRESDHALARRLGMA